MRYLLIVLILSGCASAITPAQRAQRYAQRIENMIEKYGPACERIGERSTTPWAQCVVRLSEEEQLESAYARGKYAKALQDIADSYGKAKTTCRWIGELWTCR